jgi:NADPH2:quinone reductase
MKAILVAQVGPPEVMKLEEVPDRLPGAGEVLVRVKAAGVNPVETYIRSGKYPMTAPLPYTPGNDAAGVVEAAGAGVKSVKVGDRVYTSATLSGAYASMTVCPESGVHPLPEGVSFAQGAAIGVPYATAWRAIHIRGRAISAEWILIHGASGGVGVAATQIGRAWGLKIVGTAGTEMGRKLVAAQGADFVLDHTSADYLSRLMELTGGRGVDLILEMAANVNLNKDLGVLAKFGRVVVIGSRGPVEVDTRQTMGRESSILGMTLFNASSEELRGIHAGLGAGLANGSLRPVIGREIPLAEAPKAHEAIMQPGSHGKIVLIP